MDLKAGYNMPFFQSLTYEEMWSTRQERVLMASITPLVLRWEL